MGFWLIGKTKNSLIKYFWNRFFRHWTRWLLKNNAGNDGRLLWRIISAGWHCNFAGIFFGILCRFFSNVCAVNMIDIIIVVLQCGMFSADFHWIAKHWRTHRCNITFTIIFIFTFFKLFLLLNIPWLGIFMRSRFTVVAYQHFSLKSSDASLCSSSFVLGVT